jgi:hypothetical protein
VARRRQLARIAASLRVFAVVSENKRGAARDAAARFHDPEVSIERDFAQGDYHFDFAQGIDFPLEERTAIA